VQKSGPAQGTRAAKAAYVLTTVEETKVGDVMVEKNQRRMSFASNWARAGLGAVLLCAFVTPALAQSPDAAKPAFKPAAKVPAAIGAGAAAATGTPAAGEGGLKSRVESLEEQLVDMQVVVGTLESLTKSGGGASSTAFRATAAGGADSGRVEALENQIKTLSAQVQQLSDQVRGMGGVPRRSEAPAAGAQSQGAAAQMAAAQPAFGSTTVTQGGDAIGGLIEGAPSPSTATSGASALPPVPSAPGTPQTGALGATPTPVATAALAPAGDVTDPKQLYETAYGYLLQRDYGAAEVAFDDFLKKFPSDSLAGNAQYWLGESHFVRGQYKAAAGAFLKGYQSFAQSQKAPDSLLKLAMSLDRLGQKDAACSSFAELNTKFPNAGQSVKARAQSERQRVGCP
jgi:tol-pal system protein YbgF